MNPREIHCLSAGLCLGALIMFIANTIDHRRRALQLEELATSLGGQFDLLDQDLQRYQREAAERAVQQ